MQRRGRSLHPPRYLVRAIYGHPDPYNPVIPTAVEGPQPVGTRSFDYAQDDRVLRSG